MKTNIYYNDKDNKVVLVEELGIAPVRYKLHKLGKWQRLTTSDGLYGVYNMQQLGYNLIGVYYETN